jgi:CRP-like cAMP-binding protein
MRNETQTMSRHPILNRIEPQGEVLAALRFQPSQVIYYPGNPATGLYIVKKGQVKLERGDEWGHNQILSVATVGDCLGYQAVFTAREHTHQAVALTEVELVHMPRNQVPEFLTKHREVLERVLHQLASDGEELQDRLSKAFGSTAHERISDAILRLREIDPERIWSRRDIAEWAGTTPETVTRVLQDLKNAGLIHLRGRAILLTEKFILENQRH